MSTNITFGLIFFRLLNFGVLVVLIGYLFKRYFLSSIEDKINSRMSIIKGLEEQGYMLEGQAYELADQIKAQEFKCLELKNKIQDWNYAIQHDERNRLFRQELYRSQALQRSERQISQQSKEQLYAKTLPQALIIARQELKKKYADLQIHKKYLDDLITQLGDL